MIHSPPMLTQEGGLFIIFPPRLSGSFWDRMHCCQIYMYYIHPCAAHKGKDNND